MTAYILMNCLIIINVALSRSVKINGSLKPRKMKRRIAHLVDNEAAPLSFRQ